MSVIKLTGHTGKPFLISTDKVAAVFADSTGDFTVVSTETEQLYAKESVEEIEALMLRDQFAMSAMNAILSGLTVVGGDTGHGWTPLEFAEEAYKQADAMIRARESK